MDVVLCDTTFCLKPLTRLQGAWRKQRHVNMQRVAGVGEGAEKEEVGGGGGGVIGWNRGQYSNTTFKLYRLK